MGFPINFPQYRKMQQNLSHGENQGNWWSYFSHSMNPFFSIRFPFKGILRHMGNACVFSLISHNIRKDSQTHRMGKLWEIGPWLGAFFPLHPHSMVYFIICEIHGFPITFPQHERNSEIHRIGRTQKIGTQFFPNVWMLFFHQIPILWYTLPYGKCMVFPINFTGIALARENPAKPIL